MKILKRLCALAPLGALVIAAAAHAGPTLDAVKKRGNLICGVSQGLPGFSSTDEKGHWKGLDVDYCHALAATVFGDAAKVKFVPLSAKERFTALQSGEIDILSRNTTWTMTRDTQLGLNFVGVDFYDGQSFMIRKDLGLTSAKQLGGATVCSNSGTTTELNMADYFRSHGMKFTPVVFENSDQVIAAYDSGRCDVYTTDRSGLYAQRIKLKNPDANIILPEVISKEPLGPVVRQGDDDWFNVAKWTLFGLINAEEYGITSKNVDQMRKSRNPKIQRLLGVNSSLGENIGMVKDWGSKMIRQVGNYGEIYDRNLGGDPLKIPRGNNKLWTEGGLIYAPPIR